MDIEQTKAALKDAVVSCPFEIVSRLFRAQPILHSHSLKMTGIELLYRGPLPFEDPRAMLEIDIKALEHASILARHYREGTRVHLNAEPSSFVHREWWSAMIGNMAPDMVVEIVERNILLEHRENLRRACIVAEAVRNFGGVVALDDVNASAIDLQAIKAICPEIIKIEKPAVMTALRHIAPQATFVVERIDSAEMAHFASALGAQEIQGYWCDYMASELVPAVLTPPGITASDFSFQPAVTRICA